MGGTAVHRGGLDQLRGGVESDDQQSIRNGALCLALGHIVAVCVDLISGGGHAYAIHIS